MTDTRTAQAVLFRALQQLAGDAADPERLPAGRRVEAHLTAEGRIDGVHTWASFSGQIETTAPRRARKTIAPDPIDVAAWILSRLTPAARRKLLNTLPQTAEPPDQYQAEARRIVRTLRRRQPVHQPPELRLIPLPSHKPKR